VSWPPVRVQLVGDTIRPLPIWVSSSNKISRKSVLCSKCSSSELSLRGDGVRLTRHLATFCTIGGLRRDVPYGRKHLRSQIAPKKLADCTSLHLGQ
jgi:hypothetical protein